MDLSVAEQKLQALKDALDGILENPKALYLDPAYVLDIFSRYASIRDDLRGQHVEIFSDVPVRSTPESSGTTDHEGRGYIERVQLELLRRDINYCLAMFPLFDPSRDIVKVNPQPASRTGKGMPSIFLAHSSRDKFFVRKLAEQLRRHGAHVWVDEAELRVGDSLSEKIGHAIAETDFFGVVLSTNSIESKWVQAELATAMAKELSGPDKVILPLLLEPVAVPPFLRDKVYADFTRSERFDDTFAGLLKAVGLQAGSSPHVEAKESAGEEGTSDVAIREEGVLTSSEERLTRFQDVAIEGLDVDRSHNPDPGKSLYLMYLRLSDAPPEEWQRVFAAERSFPRHSMWRRAWVEGEYIVVECPPEEVEKYHLADLKQDVSNSNAKYRHYLLEQATQERESQSAGARERSELADLADRIERELRG